MVQSMNTKVDMTVKGSSYLGLGSTGKIMVGDHAFEYYNDRKVEDFIQIPWEEVDYIAASVYLKRHINRFAIFTKQDGHFSFSAGHKNKELLRSMQKYIPPERMLQSLSFFKVLKRGFKAIFQKISKKNK